MKNLILTVCMFLLMATAGFAASSNGSLTYDASSEPIQGFSPDPAKAKLPDTVGVGELSSIDTTNWSAIMFNATEEVKVYMNNDSTKYMVFPADQNHVLVINTGVTSVRFQNGGSTSLIVYVWGM